MSGISGQLPPLKLTLSLSPPLAPQRRVQFVSHGTGGVATLDVTLGEGEAAAAALRAAAPARRVGGSLTGR